MPVSKPRKNHPQGNMPPQTKNGTRRYDKRAFGNKQWLRRYWTRIAGNLVD